MYTCNMTTMMEWSFKEIVTKQCLLYLKRANNNVVTCAIVFCMSPIIGMCWIPCDCMVSC